VGAAVQRTARGLETSVAAGGESAASNGAREIQQHDGSILGGDGSTGVIDRNLDLKACPAAGLECPSIHDGIAAKDQVGGSVIGSDCRLVREIKRGITDRSTSRKRLLQSQGSATDGGGVK